MEPVEKYLMGFHPQEPPAGLNPKMIEAIRSEAARCIRRPLVFRAGFWIALAASFMIALAANIVLDSFACRQSGRKSTDQIRFERTRDELQRLGCPYGAAESCAMDEYREALVDGEPSPRDVGSGG
jgi:hypothetical protein